MSRLLRILLPTLVACTDRPAEQGTVNATLDGHVFVTGPVEGVVVSAYALDLDDGAPGSLVAQSMETDGQGAYHLELGTYHGPLLLVAQGVGGTYVEPATGVTAHWDASTQLRAVFAARTSDRDIRLALDTGEEGTAVITPWSEWAFAYSLARHGATRDNTYDDALTHAIERFRDHVELDFWNVIPTVLSDDAVGAWNNGVQAGLFLWSLSKLTAEMASESQLSSAGLSSLELVAAVRDDLSDAVLDGAGTQGKLKVGSCLTVCVLSPLTLRAHLRDAAVDFLASSANTSGITVTDASELLGRISARVGDLWSAPTVPTIRILPSSFRDDSGVDAHVEGPGVGVIQYENEGTAITLAAGESPSFVKLASRYAADSENLPEWHFAVTDNHSGDAQVTLSARLSRLSAQGAIVGLRDWFTVTPVDGGSYNRALTINSALHPDVAVVSGTYILEYRATDAFGNSSFVDCGRAIGCVKWSQVILPPPLRQRQGAGGDVCSDPAIPTGHALGVAGPCPGLNNSASANLNGPEARKIAQGYIDNPNGVAAQVVISATAPSYIRRGLKFANIEVGNAPVNRACDEAGIDPVTPEGQCYDPKPDTSEYGTEDVLDRDLATGVSVAGASTLGVDAAGRQIYEIGPRSTATVWIESSPWRFLMPRRPVDFAELGALQFVTGSLGMDWHRCVRVAMPRYGEGFEYCTAQVRVRELTQLTRATVRPKSSVTLTARPGGADEASWAPAIGTGVAGFGYIDYAWDTTASGY